MYYIDLKHLKHQSLLYVKTGVYLVYLSNGNNSELGKDKEKI